MTNDAGSGHPTSCMSCAEIFAELFFERMRYNPADAYDPGNDEFVLSKGHAAPIWYSALDRAGAIDEDLDSLRDIDSHLQGHPMPMSLDWIEEATGSLGQGVSIAVGKALAAKKQGRDYHTYCVTGDSELAEGQIYEAFQLASYNDLDNLTVICDINRLGQTGETMVGHHMDWYRDRFDAFGWHVEVVDGHSIEELRTGLDGAEESDRPGVVLAETVKGKGFPPVEDENGFHGKPLNDRVEEALATIPNPDMPDIEIQHGDGQRPVFCDNTPEPPSYSKGDELATRDAYGDTIEALAEAKCDLLAVDGEVSNSTRSEHVKDVAPDQFVESFIAEQNMVSMAQGLSIKGHEVFCSTFSVFFSRAHDQIRMTSLSETDMNFVGSHCGASIGADGASQMGLSDIATFRSLRDSTVLYPCDAVSARELTEGMYGSNGITYLRTTRPETPVIYDDSEEFPVGGFKTPRNPEDADMVLAGAGITVHQALRASEMLENEGIEAAVADIYSVKPFNADEFADFVQENGNRLVVSEDHYLEGGIGEMLGSELEGTGIEMRTLGVDTIPHSGRKQRVIHQAGIGFHAIKEAAVEIHDL